jgi:FkbM family methyltransferase
MLIPYHTLVVKHKLNVSGILHIGAHECEELEQYICNGVKKENTYWVEAMEDKVNLNKNKYNELNIYNATIDLQDGNEVVFKITNNGQSSSILEFGTHEKNHPHVHVVRNVIKKTSRMDTIIEKNNIPIEKINFINLDIQGVELRALKSMEKYLHHIDYIYTEVNIEEVYKGCDQINDLDNYLKNNGFERVDTIILKEGWGDAFYKRIKK